MPASSMYYTSSLCSQPSASGWCLTDTRRRSIAQFLSATLPQRCVLSASVEHLIETITILQAADPNWRSRVIPNANLRSHIQDPDLLPLQSGGGDDYITCFDPANNLHITSVFADDTPSIEAKIRRAKNAQIKWCETSFGERRRVMRSLLKWLVENQELCARVACRDTGKTRELI